MSKQDETNPALWLATLVGSMERSCPHRIASCVLQENALATEQPVKRGCWVWALFFIFMDQDSVLFRKYTGNEKLANTQPSWRHTWPVANIITLLVSL